MTYKELLEMLSTFTEEELKQVIELDGGNEVLNVEIESFANFPERYLEARG